MVNMTGREGVIVKKTLVVSLVAVFSLLLFSQPAFAQGISAAPWVGSGIGASYNRVTEDSHLYVSFVKVTFINFGPRESYGLFGLGYGWAQNQKDSGKDWSGLVFVPVRYGPLALEYSWDKVWATSDSGLRKRTRIVALTLNTRW